MSTPKHTPGPWHFAEPFRILKASKNRGELYLRGIGNGLTHVGYASICPIHSNGEALANARLIAASPELLEALQSTLKSLQLFTTGQIHHPTSVPEVEAQARAAIEKATKGEAE